MRCDIKTNAHVRPAVYRMSSRENWRVDAICSMVPPMNREPRNTRERPEDVVASWLTGLPRWEYSSEAIFFDALIYLRRRIQAMDHVQAKANQWLMVQDESLLKLLKERLQKLGELTQQPESKKIFVEIEAALRSRLLRSRADGRELTNMALTKLIFQLKNVEEKFLANGVERSGDEYRQLVLLIHQCKDLLRRLQDDDLLYNAFEPARSVLNAFKQQKSVVNEILSWYEIPTSEKDLKHIEQENRIKREQTRTIPRPQKIVENREELFNLPVASKIAMMTALRQAYLLFLSGSSDAEPNIDLLKSVIDLDGKISKIGTKGHEWEAFVSSAFRLNEPLFVTSRSIDKNARNFEVKLVSRLDSLEKSIAQSQSKVEAMLANAINNAKIDIELRSNREVQYEIEMEPKPGVFQRISYHLASVFRPQIEELWVDLSADIYKKYNTKDFKVSIESKDLSQVTIILDFPTDLGSLRTDIHKYVRDQLQQLKVGINIQTER